MGNFFSVFGPDSESDDEIDYNRFQIRKKEPIENKRIEYNLLLNARLSTPSITQSIIENLNKKHIINNDSNKYSTKTDS